MRLLVTAGGTGGHIFPALALAGELKKMGHTVLFVGSSAGPEARSVPAAGFEFVGIEVRGFDRKDKLNLMKALFMLPSAVLNAVKTVRAFRPDAVIGCGGYASGPSCLVAAFSGVPLFLLEQNVYPGLVTRKLAGKARRVYATFAGSGKWLPGVDVVTAGNPVRSGFYPPADRDFAAPRKTLLVMGGSQGARSINRAMMAALPLLKNEPLDVYHQTGAGDAEEVKAAYAREMPGAVVAPFFDNVAELMRKAHLAVARAGASTCTELALTALPAVLVPFPGAGGHQKLNAKAMAETGAALVVADTELSGPKLATAVQELLADGPALRKMSAGAQVAAKPDAAQRIGRDIVTMLEGA
ncbi:MAG: undecaprenyldiphospho-muramoylpentapeptide beta-N-acetylglucosaminyltransferase [Nitrospinae bacterium]|nr:undecaprenyldiphospho-muramoylpentapeptide beta-N-acetylglucosaminyltransferase [Nitrospinota bacterium]